MKILLVTTHLNYGGISSYCFSLAKSLVSKGHKVFIASSPGDLLVCFELYNIEYIDIPIMTKSEVSPRVLMSAIKLAKFIKDEEIDIIHAHTRVTQITAHYLSSFTKVPFVTTCHGFFKRNIGRQMCPAWGSKAIAISDAVRRHLMIDFYLPESKIELIPNGIDVENFRISASKNDESMPARVVGIIARLSSVKGHQYLLKAWVDVINEFPESKLMIFGDGKIKYKLIKMSEELGIIDSIYFLPSVHNISEVLQEIDIFVMPSLQEGLGLSILEAQACGVPIIASNVGGIPTIVKNDSSGILVSPKDPPAIAGAIMRLMENKALAIRLGKRGRFDVETHFNLNKMADKIEKLYSEVCKK